MRVVDLFAGWGGFSLGAESAGATLLWAGNHWDLAVQAHAANHPHATHVCQDLRQADWSALPAYDVMLASPACQGHSQAAQPSRARSGRTRAYHDALRATAWAVVDCAEVTHPRAIVLENVPDFLRWKLYPKWRECLEMLGYKVKTRILRASHFGVPQRRDRVFLVASEGEIDLRFPKKKEPGFGSHIDWHDGRWRRISDCKGVAARRRLTIASKRFGRAIVQHVSHHKGLDISEPLRTITTKDQWAVVDGNYYRPLTIRENARGMGFPESYVWPKDANRRELVTGFGNAVCPPVAKALVERVANEI